MHTRLRLLSQMRMDAPRGVALLNLEVKALVDDHSPPFITQLWSSVLTGLHIMSDIYCIACVLPCLLHLCLHFLIFWFARSFWSLSTAAIFNTASALVRLVSHIAGGLKPCRPRNVRTAQHRKLRQAQKVQKKPMESLKGSRLVRLVNSMGILAQAFGLSSFQSPSTTSMVSWWCIRVGWSFQGPAFGRT